MLGGNMCNVHWVEFEKMTYRTRILVAAGTILNST